MKSLKILYFILFVTSNISVVGQTVYTTKTGEKYHKETCRYLKYSKKTINLDRAKVLAYQACKVCKSIGYNVQNVSSFSASNSSNTYHHQQKTTLAIQCIRKTKSGE
ncbi:hypothetical protein J1D01_03820 [Seonamhaeicola sp. NFXS20]|uniref:hypothetical protein n=1 Tax=Seonamhaeicola sp. NFXS20 TaxID=2816959 RepID=UPI003B8B4324